jgi:hypothetical protein
MFNLFTSPFCAMIFSFQSRSTSAKSQFTSQNLRLQTVVSRKHRALYYGNKRTGRLANRPYPRRGVA